MSAEGMVKSQARGVLRSSNWGKALVGFFTVLTLPVLALTISSFADFFSTSKDSAVDMQSVIIVFAVDILAVCAILFLSPLYYGYCRFMYHLANGDDAQVSTIFTYFESIRMYGRAISYGISVISRYIECGLLCAVPAIICGAAWIMLGRNPDLNLFTPALGVLSVISIIGGAILLFIVTRRYYLATYLFVMDKYDTAPSQCLKKSKVMMLGNVTKAVKLTLSYIPWFALCFFVIPWFYVYPYYKTATGVSAKWLIEMGDEKWQAVQPPVPFVAETRCEGKVRDTISSENFENTDRKEMSTEENQSAEDNVMI